MSEVSVKAGFTIPITYCQEWRPPESQRRANREWVREQLIKLTEGSRVPDSDEPSSPADYHLFTPAQPWTGSTTAATGSGVTATSGGAMGIQGTTVTCPYEEIDNATLRWRAWNGGHTDPALLNNHVNDMAATAEHQHQVCQQEAAAANYEILRNLTQHEFRRLTEQVRQVTAQTHQQHRYRGTGFKRFYCNENGQNVPLVHRSQLAASLKSSLKVFHNRKWLPYQPTFELPEPPIQPRSRPGSSKQPDTERRISSAGSSVIGHKKSRATSPLSIRPTQLRAAESITSPLPPPPRELVRFDCLTPDIVYKLSDGVEPSSVYGERPNSSLSVLPDPSQRKDKLSARLREEEEEEEGQSETGGEQVESRASNPAETLATQLAPIADSDESDDENIPEPRIEEVAMTRIPALHLRPEQIDNIHVPARRNDPRRFDFDVDNVEMPVYQFKNPMPEELHNFSFKEASKSDKPWQVLSRYRPKDRSEDELISRLMEFERLQRKTEEWENQRKCKVQNTKFKARVLASTVLRPGAGRASRDANKKCTLDCVQAACVGDCPGKTDSDFQPACLVCQQVACNGNCNSDIYQSHSRNDGTKADVVEEKKAAMKTAETKRSSSVARYAQSTNASVARSRTPLPARSSSSAGRSRDNRSKAEVTSPTRVEDEMDKLSLEQDDEEEKLQPRYRGRAAQVPGKSMFSQRRNSLTDIAREVKMRAMLKKRAKSGRKKRPKTAM